MLFMSKHNKFWILGAAFGAKFGASLDYNHIEEETEYNLNIFTQSEANCCAYTSDVQTFSHPDFTQNFINGLNFLSEDYEDWKYRLFIDEFGTHYVKHADMGAFFGQQSEISYDEWNHMVNQ